MTARLPVIGSTASSTAFCSAQLDGPGGLSLYFDGNGKVTAGNGTLHDPKPNAFSLPAAAISGVEHCPGSTPTCRAACYVGPLSRAQADLYALYNHNAEAIRVILDGCEVHPKHGMIFTELAAAWAQEFAAWIVDNAPAGFRWHVSGDVYSIEYAHFIAAVCEASKPVPAWIYTRSFDLLEPLAKVSTLRGGNLAVNLSCDVDNYTAATKAAHAHGVYAPLLGEGDRLRLCYLTVDGQVPAGLDADDVIFPDYALRPRAVATLADSEFWQSLSQFQRGLVCPVDAHGKAENRRCGPCSRCLT